MSGSRSDAHEGISCAAPAGTAGGGGGVDCCAGWTNGLCAAKMRAKISATKGCSCAALPGGPATHCPGSAAAAAAASRSAPMPPVPKDAGADGGGTVESRTQSIMATLRSSAAVRRRLTNFRSTLEQVRRPGSKALRSCTREHL